MESISSTIRFKQNDTGERMRSHVLCIVICSIVMIAILCGPIPTHAAAVVHSSGGSSTIDLARGVQLMRDGKYSDAKVEFTAVIKMNPQSVDGLTWRGICENQLNQYHEAAQDFRNALRVDPRALPAHYNLALSLIRLGKNDDAIGELETVVQAQPDAVDAQYNVAVLLESKQDFSTAVEHLKLANAVQPNDIRVVQHLLVDYLKLGRSVEAQATLQQLKEIDASPQTQLQIGSLLLENGYPREAVAIIEIARSKLPASKRNDLLLALAYIGAEDASKAIDLLKPIEYRDASGESAYLLGLAYAGGGSAHEAAEAFQTASKSNPHDARPFFQLGIMYSLAQERQPEALYDLQKAVHLDPENSTYTIALAEALLQDDKAENALGILEHLHTADTKEKEAERNLLLGIAQVATSGVALATPTLEHAVKLNPSLALSHNMLGFCYFRHGDYARAAQSYQRAADLRPDSLIFTYDTALAFERANNATQALIYAERAVSLSGARSDDYYLLGKLYAQAGRNEDAVRELKHAIAINADLDNPYYLLARTYMKMGNSAEASVWSSKLTALKEKHEQAYKAHKSTSPVQFSSSALMKGAPMNSEQEEDSLK